VSVVVRQRKKNDMRAISTAVLTVALTVSSFAQTARPNAEGPKTNVIAIVLGKKITVAEKGKLNDLIFESLLLQYAKENKIEPTEAELDTFMAKMAEMEKTMGNGARMGHVDRQKAQVLVKAWKINKALYEKYGGRVVSNVTGAMPIDAYRDFLKEKEKKGVFLILDKQCKASFWHSFTYDAKNKYYRLCKKEEGSKLINTPAWLREQPAKQ